MVAAYHLIWTNYGYWLPNDPRGSTSHEIRAAKIESLGEIHYGRKRVQPAGRVIREFHEAAQGVLKHPFRCFQPEEFEILAESFAVAIKRNNYTCYACAIMPDHVHMIIRKHRDKAEQMIERLQSASREALRTRSFPMEHPVWGGPGWKVFLDSSEDIKRTVQYVEQNPVKIWRPVQNWSFVTDYDGWLPGRPSGNWAYKRNMSRVLRED